jgi:acetyl esterase/lipase
MKKLLILPFLLLFLTIGCSTSDDAGTKNLEAKTLLNVAYGPEAGQDMDVYLPAGRASDATKVLVLVHGGSWVAGSKEDLALLVPIVQQKFPGYAIVNINYRLATEDSPALPKQVDDIQKVIDYLESSSYHIADEYAFIGFSAGAHLSMLYSYGYDPEHKVKAVCNVVGPADFTDPAYLEHELYPFAALYLIGTSSPTQEQITNASPVTYITAQSPPTITFYGGQDPLVPASQGPLLKAKLDDFGVYNEFNFYPDGGHGDWDALIFQEVYGKIEAFLQLKF